MQRRLMFAMSIVASFVVCPVVAQPDDADPSQNHDRIRELADRYWEHRQSFNPLSCVYTVESHGTASSLDQLIAGDVDFESASDGTLKISGDYVLWISESRQPERVESVDEEAHVIVVSGVSIRYLSGEGNHLESTGRGSARLIAAGEEAVFYGPSIHPLDLGMMGSTEDANPHARIAANLDKTEYVGERTHFGVTAEGVRVSKASSGRTDIWFAPEWGYLRVRIESYHGEELLAVALITEVEQLSEGRWFPLTVLRFSGEVQHLDSFEAGTLVGSVTFSVDRIQTLSVDVDTAPDESEFQLEFTDPTTFLRGGIGIRRMRDIHASEIDDLIDEIEQFRR